ncbi:hypothetical protein O3G_MSEX011057 [Manduca sexta]|uniref:VWFC domain-containing protein n=1 Tax=Manduca sexta TaxID=7130 RepID=A0A921ZIT7_MANSE|nr:hypothetical protein O3G_MSEX011057 [Manduca sexta]KAG6458803.1 hypothetical protein O3G_MSEX011057 [Manduca sexta]
MERRRAAGALLALAACILCTAAAPTASNHTALNLYDAEPEGCYYNFQHYGEGDRIMTNEPCLNCTCHNRMLMCYLRVCPFTKPIGQDCTVEKRADQCCPIVTCPDVPVDLLTLTSTTSPAEYGATGVGKLDKYGCSINGKYFPEGSKVPPTPNKPCEHCYCIRNMTTCVMQECTLHVDGCTPIYHKDVCCPVRYSCDHPEDEILLLDDKTTTVRPTPGFLLTTTTNSPVTQFTQDCVHDDQIFADGALIKTEKACEHCYCMKGDIVCVVQECGTPMENEGKNCTSLPPREGQCCPDTYICEGDELNTEYPMDLITENIIEDLTTLSPPRRVSEGSGYRKEPDNIDDMESHPTESTHEGSGDALESDHTIQISDMSTTEDNTNYIYSTIPSLDNADKEDFEQDTSAKPSDETPSITDLEDGFKTTTSSGVQHEIKQDENVEPDRVESSTSGMASYDHKLETSPPEEQAVIDKEKINVPEDKVRLTTMPSILEEKESTTASKSYEENIATNAFTVQHDVHISTTIHPILEDEGITTESDREQQTIVPGSFEEHSHDLGLHTASTTSAPFLEEVERIPTGTYEQHVVTDEITEGDTEDTTKDRTDAITTPIYEDSDNLIDIHKHKDHSTETQSTLIPKLDEFAHSTTIVPSIEEAEKTSTKIPEDLTTSKPSEETFGEDKFVPTSTYQPITNESLEAITATSEEHLATTQESSDSQKTAVDTEKSQTVKYEQVTEKNTYDDHANIPTTASAPVIEEDSKASEVPESVTSEATGSEITDEYDTVSTIAPNYHDHLTTTENKDIVESQEKASESSTKPTFIKEGEKESTQDVSYDISTEKHPEQETYESQKPVGTNAPISEDAEIATTEFVKDQDFVTTGIVEQDSVKPSNYVPSTSSTPFLEEIEKLTTEISQGHVVTDVITEKEDFKPPKQETSDTESPPALDIEDITTSVPDRGLNTIPSGIVEAEESSKTSEITTPINDLQDKDIHATEGLISDKETQGDVYSTVASSIPDDSIVKDDKAVATTEPLPRKEDEHHVEIVSPKEPELVTEVSRESFPTTESLDQQETKSPSQSSTEETPEIHENIPHEEATVEAQTEENITEKGMKPDIVELVVPTTQITPNAPEVTTINLGENEIDEDNLLSPGRIPGEGDCLLNGVTYKNESSVPNTNKCHSNCRCISSIVKCSPIICSAPPEYIENCQPIYDSPDACCPTYVCDQFRETLPPMPHIHITTTELPQQPSIECRGDQCEVHEDKIHPVESPAVCANNDCGSEADKKTDISSCGPHGCVESPETPECTNDDCKHPPTNVPLETQCESGNCESSPANLPQTPECENGVCKDEKVPEIIPESCTEEGGCKGTDVNVIQDCADESCRRKETSDIEKKPSLCAGPHCEKETPIQEPIETSTLGETIEIKTESPELDISDSITTEDALHDTIAPEKHEVVTEINAYDTTISIDSHKEPISPGIQEEPKLPELLSTEKEFITETYTKSPPLATDIIALSTKIPEEYVTESDKDVLQTKIPEDVTQTQQIITETSKVQYEDQSTFETSKDVDEAHTEPTKYVPDTEENTIKVMTNDEIPTEQPIVVETNEILDTTSKPEVSEPEKLTTQIPEHGISEVTESQVTELQEGTTLSETPIVEHEKYTQAPVYDVSKSKVVTPQTEVETGEEVTTEYISGPKGTTLAPTDLHVTQEESDEKVTKMEIEKGNDEKFTKSQESATESQAISSEFSTQEYTEDNLPHPIPDEEHALPTESSAATTEQDLKATDKVTHVTDENVVHPEANQTQKPDKEYDVGTELPVAFITETIGSISEPSITKHEEHTEHVLISTPSEERESEIQKDTDVGSTLTPHTDKDETINTIPEQEATEASPGEPHKNYEEIFPVTSDHDISTESIVLPVTTDSSRITETPQGVDDESVQTGEPETTSAYAEHVIMEHVTLPEKATEIPEILSHKKEHSSETPMVSESGTEKPTEAEETIKQEEPSADKTVSSITAEPESQTELSETVTEEHRPTVIDETTDTEIVKEKTEKPTLVPETEATYASGLDKSTEHIQTVTVLPESQELFIPVKTETTTILTPIEKETASGLTEIISVTEKADDVHINIGKVEGSTDKPIFEGTSPQSYAPETQEPENRYTEKVPTGSFDSTTKTLEAITTEPSNILVDISTLAAPEIHETIPAMEEEIHTKAPEIQDTTKILAVDISKDKEVTTEMAVEHNTEEDLVTKIQDDVTEHQEIITNVPEIDTSMSSHEPSEAPEVSDTIVTEPQDINKVSDEAQVTELQTPSTETEYSRTTEQPEKEEHIKQIGDLPTTDAPKAPTEVLTILEVHTTSPDLQATVGESVSTDREEITLSSASPDITEKVSVTVTESDHLVTTVPESSSIKSEEPSTSLPHDAFTHHEITPTISSESITEEIIEGSSRIPDLEKVEHEEPITKAPEPAANVDDVTPSDDSHTVLQETATEKGEDVEVSTEPLLQTVSESHDQSERPKPTSVPVPDLLETTPYLVELQEHTHMTIQEVTTSSPIEKEIITEQIVTEKIGNEHAVSEITTEAYVNKQTEIQEPTKHYEESSTLLETLEKTTQATQLKDEQSIPTIQPVQLDVKETTIYKDKDLTTLAPTQLTEVEKEATPEAVVTDNIEKTVTTSEKPVQSDLTVGITTPEEATVLSTEKSDKTEELPTQSPVIIDKITKPEEKPVELPTPLPDLSKPGTSDSQPTDEVPIPDEETHFPSSGSSGYGGEPDYVEEDQAFGPGTCRYGGKVYVSAQQIPRDDPCDFCFCFRSDIICLQQSCPPPIHGCHEEPIQGFCCPRYECPVSMATTLNVTTTTTTTTTTLPPHFPTHSYKGAAQRRGCQIKGHTYKVGEVVRSSSGPCLHCTCGGDGQMKCDPKACTPEPMLRQMIAAAVSAKRRR